MLNLADLTRTIKKYALNSSMSNEEFLNAFLLPFVIAGNIRNKNQEEFHLNKARTSEIMNHKADVPVALRNALSRYGIREKTIEGMISFVEDFIDFKYYDQLIKELRIISREEKIVFEPFENIKSIKEELSILLTDLIIRAISENNMSSPEIVSIWKNGLSSIDVQSGDLLRFGFNNRRKKKNIIVIPVNTAFDTHVTRTMESEAHPLVSENTVHGQWLVRLKESGEQLDQIDDRITESLKKTGFLPEKEAGGENGKRVCYPIGSVAVIETNNAIYFLMAMAEFDDCNNARSSSNDIKKAIQSLLEVYDRLGLGYDLYLPLMGTGLSRAGLSIPEAYNVIVKSLMSYQDRIHGRIHLIIKQEDRTEIVL